MLHNKYAEGIQDKIAIFEVSRVILKDQGVLFSDGNVSNQQLSKYSGERVGITPITVSGADCIRKYHPGGPYGTNVGSYNCYSGVTFLEHLAFDVINIS